MVGHDKEQWTVNFQRKEKGYDKIGEGDVLRSVSRSLRSVVRWSTPGKHDSRNKRRKSLRGERWQRRIACLHPVGVKQRTNLLERNRLLAITRVPYAHMWRHGVQIARKTRRVRKLMACRAGSQTGIVSQLPRTIVKWPLRNVSSGSLRAICNVRVQWKWWILAKLQPNASGRRLSVSL